MLVHVNDNWNPMSPTVTQSQLNNVSNVSVFYFYFLHLHLVPLSQNDALKDIHSVILPVSHFLYFISCCCTKRSFLLLFHHHSSFVSSLLCLTSSAYECKLASVLYLYPLPLTCRLEQSSTTLFFCTIYCFCLRQYE